MGKRLLRSFCGTSGDCGDLRVAVVLKSALPRVLPSQQPLPRSPHLVARTSTHSHNPSHPQCLEVGSIFFGQSLRRTPGASEAIHLALTLVFGPLGYKRLEWKCDALNAPSRAAALRFGFRFEGLFRRHMVVKGRVRNTAWYAMVLEDWAGDGSAARRGLRQAYGKWLSPANCGSPRKGPGKWEQLERLGDLTKAALGECE